MKYAYAAIAGVVTALAVSTADAQNAVSGAAANAQNANQNTNASVSYAEGGNNVAVYIPENLQTSNTQTVRNTGRTEVLNSSGGAMAPAVFSGTHPCVLGASIGLAGIAGNLTGLSGGGTIKDEECTIRMEAMVLAGMGMQREAMLHLAIHDETLRRTLVEAGRVSIPAEGGATVATKSVKKPAVAYRKCGLNAAGKIELSVKRGMDRDLAISQCKAALR